MTGTIKHIFCFVMLVQGMLISLPAFPQIREARKSMTLFNYSEAIFQLNRVMERGDPDERKEATLLLAECHWKQKNFERAASLYRAAIGSVNFRPEDLFHYAQCLRSLGDYAEAKKRFLASDSLVPGGTGKIFAAYCDSALSWSERPPVFTIRNAKNLNSSQSEFGTIVYGEKILFTSDRLTDEDHDPVYGWTGHGFLRLYLSAPGEDDIQYRTLNKPEMFPFPYDKDGHFGPAVANRTLDTMYINLTMDRTDKGKKDPGRIRTHLLKLYTSVRSGNSWSEPLSFFLNSKEFSVGHPALSMTGDTLFFVSDRPGGCGGTDLYFVIRSGKSWTGPVNPGSGINTPGNEMFPVVQPDGDLFFSSDGLPGFGGLDIYRTRFSGGLFTSPVNMGKPVNSSYDDFSFQLAPDRLSGYISSNRTGGMGGDDIYFVEKVREQPPVPEGPVFANGCVKEKSSGIPVPGATVFILETGKAEVRVIQTGKEGCFRVPVEPGAGYTFKAARSGFLPDCLTIGFPVLPGEPERNLPRHLLLDKLELKKTFMLENIYYDFDKWNIRTDAEPALDYLAGILRDNPVSIELGSHTDCRGTEEYNRELSQKRAESAVNYIIRRGISPSRISAIGYGESRLINRCNCSDGVICSEKEHQENRRTEFTITGLHAIEAVTGFDPSLFTPGIQLTTDQLPPGFFEDCVKK